MAKSDAVKNVIDYVAYLDKYKLMVSSRISEDDQLLRWFLDLSDAFGDIARYVRHIENGNDNDVNRFSSIQTACWDIGMNAMALYCEATKRQAQLDSGEAE